MESSPSSFALSAGVSFCVTGERMVFLDQIADRYLALGADEEDAFVHLLSSSSRDSLREKRLTRLVDGGLLVQSQSPALPRPCDMPSPVGVIAASRLRRVPPFTQFRFALRVMWARRRLRQDGLYKTLQAFRLSKALRTQSPNNTLTVLHEAADLLAHISRYITRLDQCLPIALGMGAHLLRGGVDCNIVLGVQLGPFQAHSWVQHGDRLIGDDLDVVRTFTPILVV